MKQKLTNKMKQQGIDLMSLLTDNKLNEKEGTHNTLVRTRWAEIWTVPIWVTAANFPFGSLTVVETLAVIEVKKEIEQIM